MGLREEEGIFWNFELPFFGCGEELRNYMLKLSNVIGNSAWKSILREVD